MVVNGRQSMLGPILFVFIAEGYCYKVCSILGLWLKNVKMEVNLYLLIFIA